MFGQIIRPVMIDLEPLFRKQVHHNLLVPMACHDLQYRDLRKAVVCTMEEEHDSSQIWLRLTKTTRWQRVDGPDVTLNTSATTTA
jgi:hypothetical protein